MIAGFSRHKRSLKQRYTLTDFSTLNVKILRNKTCSEIVKQTNIMIRLNCRPITLNASNLSHLTRTAQVFKKLNYFATNYSQGSNLSLG